MSVTREPARESKPWGDETRKGSRANRGDGFRTSDTLGAQGAKSSSDHAAVAANENVLRNQSSAAFALLAAYYLVQPLSDAMALHVGVENTPLITVGNLILIAILSWECYRNPPKKIELEGMTTWVSISLFAAFYVLTTYADFFIAIAVVMFVLSTSWGEKRLHVAALISVTVPLLSCTCRSDSSLLCQKPR